MYGYQREKGEWDELEDWGWHIYTIDTMYKIDNLPTIVAAKLLQSCPTLCNPIDGSPPGSAIPGTFQARTLEWVAISFSGEWKWKVKVKSLSCVWLFATPWIAAYQAPPSMGFSRQEYWSGLPLPSLKESWAWKNWYFWTVVLEKTLVSPLDCKIQPINPQGNLGFPMNIHWKDWCWRWNSNTLATWCEELTHL